ncbi:hypothetical protein [Methylocystis parvus]|uniref:Uncharacterized protein n=1 Tax=Methylocystis parvus TaxID=134 RepID=A0A6B8M7V0_9HYPH|nr:hypothetical protein [Methylocystis parvus]QGM98475.1 hypothetical protein F7D14_13995 [Methylocystis parvus]WBK01187.1 hypothetical protein MMG94_05575 [Methylocystis parvus OBBP]
MPFIIEINCGAPVSMARRLLTYGRGDVAIPQRGPSAGDPPRRRVECEPKRTALPVEPELAFCDVLVVSASILGLVATTIALVRLVDVGLDALCR